ncbi:MAG: BTAD domain-containing putative transcriptional regulator [Eubacteriales bacterium]|nr:BTAD domain-containing putative transcriptional regulator [Eubacteriales bacterium]
MEADKTLVINTLGSFTVVRDGVNLTLKHRMARKPWMLLKYLIAARGRLISKEKLADFFGSDEYYGNPSQQINNLVYRLRQMIGETSSEDILTSSLICENGGYRWNRTGFNSLDLDMIDDMFNMMQRSDLSDDKCIEISGCIMNIYQYDFLPENESDEWTHTTRLHYRNLYNKTVIERIACLSLQADYQEIIETCKSALDVDYFNVPIHVEYLKALLQMDNVRAALSHYEEATSRLYTNAGISPSPVMMSIYKTIKQNKSTSQFSFNEINKNLLETMKTAGALVCDTKTFSFIYNLEKNRDIRFDQSVYLVLLSFIHKDGTIANEGLLNMEMDKLEEILVNTLRGTDLISKWSTSQYLILLYRTKSEHIDNIFKRVEERYTSNESGLSIIKSFRRI